MENKKESNNNICYLKRDILLKRLGITLWKLKYPILLSNTMPIKLYRCLRLLLISNIPISLDDPFIGDVVRAMNINVEEVYAINISQIEKLKLPLKFFCYCWWIGIQQSSKYIGISLNTPELSILKNDIQAKRDFWNQIIRNLYILKRNSSDYTS